MGSVSDEHHLPSHPITSRSRRRVLPETRKVDHRVGKERRREEGTKTSPGTAGREAEATRQSLSVRETKGGHHKTQRVSAGKARANARPINRCPAVLGWNPSRLTSSLAVPSRSALTPRECRSTTMAPSSAAAWAMAALYARTIDSNSSAVRRRV